MATAAPPKPDTTTAFIPPPPLPEFYLPRDSPGTDDGNGPPDAAAADSRALVPTKPKGKAKTKAKTSKPPSLQVVPYAPDAVLATEYVAVPTKQTAVLADATNREEMIRTKVVRTTSEPVIIPPPPPCAGDGVPPLAVYHICRICLRPRSAHYHRDHPIPINGIPPPPGICRRCRVAPVEEIKTYCEVVTKGESNPMRIGVAAFVPDEDYVSNKEMKDRVARRVIRSASRHRVREETESDESVEEETKVTYRHVRVRESTQDTPSLRPKPKTSRTAQDAIDDANSHMKKAEMMTTAAAATKVVNAQHYADWPPPVGEGVTRAKVSTKTQDKQEQVAAYAASSVNSSPTKTKTKAEVFVATQGRPDRTDSEIRRIAREEVERYRQAERRMESHPGAFAHGRMVPVERRIERERDDPEALPWDRKVERIEVEVSRESRKGINSLPPASSGRDERSPGRGSTTHPLPSFARSQRSVRTASQAMDPLKRTDSVRSEPRGGSDNHRSSRGVDREIVIERVRRPESQAYNSSYASGSGWTPEKGRSGPELPLQTNVSEQRSARSEIRKWDLMTESSRSRHSDDADPYEAVRSYGAANDYHEREPYTARESRSPAQVIEQFELAPRRRQREPDIPDRIQELKDECDRQERASVAASQREQQSTSQRSQASDKTYWQDDDTGKPRKVQSSRYEGDVRYRRSESRSEIARGPSSLEERFGSSGAAGSRRSAVAVDDAEFQRTRPRAYDLRMAAMEERQRQNALFQPARSGRSDERANGGTSASGRATQQPSAASSRRDHQPDNAARPSSASTRAPNSAASARSKRTEPSPDAEWIYTKRIVEPVSESRLCDDGLHRFVSEDETIYRSSKSPTESGKGSAQTPSQASARSKQPHRQEPKVGDSEHGSSARVHFASKIEISPTPPRSDASSQRFEDFRIIGGRGSRTRRRMGGERPEELIEEYERRGRARFRDSGTSRSRRGYSHRNDGAEDDVYGKGSDDGWGVGSRVGSAREGREAWSKAAAGSQTSSRSHPLAEALSESPSRELDKADKSDGWGPYRPEVPRGPSTEVQDGSYRSSVGPDKRYGHAHGPWPEPHTDASAW